MTKTTKESDTMSTTKSATPRRDLRWIPSTSRDSEGWRGVLVGIDACMEIRCLCSGKVYSSEEEAFSAANDLMSFFVESLGAE
jgi:hypothetical protein